MKKIIQDKKAFTLIEILVAMAIVAILASVILVSINSYRAKARSTKALASLSSAVPSMISCWGNGGDVKTPASGDSICEREGVDVASYGKWPAVSSGDLSSYGYEDMVIDNAEDRSHSWAFSLSSDDDDRKICCNSAMNNCKILDAADDTCAVDDPAF